MIHAHLDHGELVLGLKAQQLQWKAKAVIQIALRPEHVEFRAKRCGNRFLRSGFTCRAGDADDVLAPLAAHMRREGLHGGEGVLCDEQRNRQGGVGQASNPGTRDDSGNRPALACGSNVIVAIEALTANRKEEIAESDGA